MSGGQREVREGYPTLPCPKLRLRAVITIYRYLCVLQERSGPHHDLNRCIHYSIQCDGCNMMPLRGKRYKCRTCLDYDLCESCEKQGIHPQHDMFQMLRTYEVRIIVVSSRYFWIKNIEGVNCFNSGNLFRI